MTVLRDIVSIFRVHKKLVLYLTTRFYIAEPFLIVEGRKPLNYNAVTQLI